MWTLVAALSRYLLTCGGGKWSTKEVGPVLGNFGGGDVEFSKG